MRAIDKVDSPAKEQVLTAYDQILLEGKEEGIKVGIEQGIEQGLEQGMEKGRLEERAKKNFQVFKKGIPLGLSISDLIALTDVDEKTAKAWMKLLKADPNAELPEA